MRKSALRFSSSSSLTMSSGKNDIIETPKKREILSRSLRLGRYVPVSHLEIVFGATFRCAASASCESPSPLL